MAELHGRVFGATERRPALALRRGEGQCGARPAHEEPQAASAPDAAGAGGSLRARPAEAGPRGGRRGAEDATSHPHRVGASRLEGARADADVIAASGRLEATFAILRNIAATQEKALVFIEHRQMQYRFIELVKATFSLKRVDLINGDTPIDRRQAIVDRFQGEGPGFDLLVLGPKAAGTG